MDEQYDMYYIHISLPNNRLFVDEMVLIYPYQRFIGMDSLHEQGLTDEQIGKLKLGLYNTSRDSGSDSCSICLDAYQEDDKVHRIDECNHLFHSQCLFTWLKTHKTCPLCRQLIDV